MPWPMLHFSIAFKMFDGNPPPPFLLGSIAPDAIHARLDDRSAKAKSHLHGCTGSSPNWDGLSDFYMSRIDDFKDEENKLFMQGYVGHIIADHLWGRYKREISGSDKTLLEKLWQEENLYDFILYRTASWHADIEEKVNTSKLFELPGIYESAELELWRRQVFKWLHTPGNEPRIHNQYLHSSNVERFIDAAALEIKQWIKQNEEPFK